MIFFEKFTFLLDICWHRISQKYVLFVIFCDLKNAQKVVSPKIETFGKTSGSKTLIRIWRLNDLELEFNSYRCWFTAGKDNSTPSNTFHHKIIAESWNWTGLLSCFFGQRITARTANDKDRFATDFPRKQCINNHISQKPIQVVNDADANCQLKIKAQHYLFW